MAAPPLEQLERRRPPAPLPHDDRREFAFQALATASLALGLWYLAWRWTASLNPEALWFSVPLALAESLSFVGTTLFFLSTWRTRDPEKRAPPVGVNDILATPLPEDRPLVVDFFIATVNEDVELVRRTLKDAKALRYPHPLDLRIHVLDDGRRERLRAIAQEEHVGYLTRPDKLGFKAGALRNAMDQTGGDLLVVCDADMRPFEGFLEETLGHFRDPLVAWVQTPQWFYDLDEGTRLPAWLARRLRLGRTGRLLGRALEALVGPVSVGADPFGEDPRMFYDVILRRRNWCNASFCCGGGSVHRREAVMEAAVRAYALQVELSTSTSSDEVPDEALRRELREALVGEAAREVELTPYKFHVSEDIYTSLVLHADEGRRWRSVFHPTVLTRSLSPQDLLTWTIQHYKYAAGTLDILRRDNPLRLPGLSGWQKLMYAQTMFSYLSPLWIVPFLAAPIVYMFCGVAPIAAYDAAFLAHFAPFLVLNKVAFMVGTWGVNPYRGEQYFIDSFPLYLRAMADVLRRRSIHFTITPKTRQAARQLRLVAPQLALVALVVVGLVYRGLRSWSSPDPVLLPAYFANVFWSVNNLVALSGIVSAALRRGGEGSP